jgi:hypothetical protein
MGSEDTQNHARTEKEKMRESGVEDKKMESGEGDKKMENGEGDKRRESGEGKCGTCAQPATLKCTACKLVSYCDKNCQAAPT